MVRITKPVKVSKIPLNKNTLIRLKISPVLIYVGKNKKCHKKVFT